MTNRDREEFIAYLVNCTDRQVLGVLEKEQAANRQEYVALAREEAIRRNLI